jgi:hypothetical protein
MHTEEKISELAVLICGLDYLSREAATEGFPQLSQNIRKVIEMVEKDCSDGESIFERIVENCELLNMLDLYYLMRETGIRNIKQVGRQLRAADETLDEVFRRPVKAINKPN